MQNNLTTLAEVKAWAGVTTSNDDLLLTRLIASASRFILSYLQRPTLFLNVFADKYDGVGQRGQMLRNWPVISVASVQVGNLAVPAALTATGCGYVFDAWDGFPPGRPQELSFRGYEFCRGRQNIAVTYTAGFVVQNEPQTVPSSGTFSVGVNAPNGNFGIDNGVTYANGTALAPQTSNADLTAGQYYADPDEGIYYFSPSDAGQAVLITYSYVPADIEDACVNMVVERYKYKGRIGIVSQSLAGQETISYSQKNMPDFVTTMLQPYRRVVLV